MITWLPPPAIFFLYNQVFSETQSCPQFDVKLWHYCISQTNSVCIRCCNEPCHHCKIQTCLNFWHFYKAACNVYSHTFMAPWSPKLIDIKIFCLIFPFLKLKYFATFYCFCIILEVIATCSEVGLFLYVSAYCFLKQTEHGAEAKCILMELAR